MPKAAGNRFRLVALDIDGTILDSAQRIAPELKEALAGLVSRSVRVVLCTGRRWRSAVPILTELEHAHPIVVCCGGALVKRVDDESTLYARPLEHATAREAAAIFRRNSLVPMLLYDRPLSGLELKIAQEDRAQAEQLPYLVLNPGVCEWYAGDYPSTDERPLIVYTLDEGYKVRAAQPDFREHLGERAVVQAMAQARYGADQVALEVHDPASTKWRALHWLLKRWRILPEQVVAVGDDVNDVPMLRAAGLSFAMGNASQEVKAAADAVTRSNDEHGVVEALRSAFGRPGGTEA